MAESHREAVARRCPAYGDARAISPDGWRALYWGEERPSIRILAVRLQITPDTVRKLIRAAGIMLRSKSEQYKADAAAGRIQRASNPAGNPQNLIVGLRTGARLSRETRLKITGRPKDRIQFVCDWCGASGEKPPHRYHRSRYHFCNRACGGAYSSWRRLTPEEPRPLILARLQKALSGRPGTWDVAEQLGRPFGAREPEIIAALTENL